MAVLGCMEAGQARGRWRWAVWGGRGFQPNSLPGAQATQQAGSKAPHLWPQGSPNIRSILFRNLLFCYTLMCFYRFPAVTIYCFPNKKFKKPNKRLVSYPSFKDAVSAESLGLGVFNYTLPKGPPSTLQLPGDELLPFTLHVHLRPVVKGCPVPWCHKAQSDILDQRTLFSTYLLCVLLSLLILRHECA